MFTLYMLRCGDGSLYIGHTDDLERRMEQHETNAYGGYTADKHPLRLVWIQELSTRWEALERERQIKGWSRKKKEALIRGDWNEIRRLARAQKRAPLDSPSAARTARSR